MEKALNKEKDISVTFMDLSKASFSKTKATWFLKINIKFHKNRRQKVQIKNKLNRLKEVIAGVPQGSIDVALDFNLFAKIHLLFFIFVLEVTTQMIRIYSPQELISN